MQKKEQDNYFPVLIDLRKLKVLVIGGGNISTRKVSNLIEFNAKITVISPEFSNKLLRLAEQTKIHLIQKEFSEGDILGFNFVFCSTGEPEIDAKVHKECLAKGVLINVADVPELCNFIIPATIKRGSLTISIASQGKAPFFVRELRKKLSLQYGEDYSVVIDIAAELRAALIKSGFYRNEKIREEVFDEFFKIDFSFIIKKNGIEAARNTALALLEKLT